MATGVQLQWPSDLAATEANLKSSSLEPVAHNNLSHTNVYWACVLKHLQVQASNQAESLKLVSIFLHCPLTSNPKNLSLVGKNRNRTGKAMDLKSISGISVWTNLSWWAYERTALESTVENLSGKKNPVKLQRKSLLQYLKITLQRMVMVMWEAHTLSELK